MIKVIRIRAVRRRHCVGGGAPVNFGRRHRSQIVDGGAALIRISGLQ